MAEVIRLDELTKLYNGFPAVDRLTLSIGSDVCVGFLGPNGAGKTTTIKVLTSLLRATSGYAYIQGIDVMKNPKLALMDVGSVVEIPEFYSFLTPMETLSYLGKIRGMGEDYIERRSKEVLSTVHLWRWAHQKIGKFSKGMKQRLGVAQALLHEPTVFILDEPTSGLDPRGMVEMRQIIRDLKKEMRTIFMSSHLLYEAQEVCDKVALIDKGKLLLYDDVENLSALTKVKRLSLSSLQPIGDDQVSKIEHFPGVLSVQRLSQDSLVLEFEGDDAGRAELLQYALELGVKVTSFQPEGMELEDMYMRMITESS